jgi:hypothetical protein
MGRNDGHDRTVATGVNFLYMGSFLTFGERGSRADLLGTVKQNDRRIHRIARRWIRKMQ